MVRSLVPAETPPSLSYTPTLVSFLLLSNLVPTDFLFLCDSRLVEDTQRTSGQEEEFGVVFSELKRMQSCPGKVIIDMLCSTTEVAFLVFKSL